MRNVTPVRGSFRWNIQTFTRARFGRGHGEARPVCFEEVWLRGLSRGKMYSATAPGETVSGGKGGGYFWGRSLGLLWLWSVRSCTSSYFGTYVIRLPACILPGMALRDLRVEDRLKATSFA